ncbi:MAG: AmmeMemoRadiSam system protein A [Epsilonproteobacteria bacterium]|nr:AmmeMemoRadiSam system protein A [Campylobacterota bacterium]
MNEEQKRVLLEIARKAIEEEFTKTKLIDRDQLVKEHPWLLEKRAVFVTLNKNHNLRGCIGSIIPHRALIDDLIANAKAAAFSDPRFNPLTAEELPQIELEISLLTVPKELPYTDIEDLKRKIRPGIDGVVLQLNGYQATFLPQVWEDLKTFEEFFAHLCLKASLPIDCLKYHPKIYTYQAEKIK